MIFSAPAVLSSKEGMWFLMYNHFSLHPNELLGNLYEMYFFSIPTLNCSPAPPTSYGALFGLGLEVEKIDEEIEVRLYF
jgi:hypothetical protein